MNKNQNRHFVSKGWGWEDWICNNEKYCGKRMFCKSGKKCSWHYHKIKDETFLIESGKLLLEYYSDIGLSVTLQDEINFLENSRRSTNYGLLNSLFKDKSKIVLESGDSFHIPIGMRHRFTGLTDCFFTEFSTHHEDSDSYRIIKGD